MRTKYILVFIIIFGLSQFILGEDKLPPEVRLGIVNRTKISIAVLPFKPATGLWEDSMLGFQNKLNSTIKGDLDFSIFFETLDSLEFPQSNVSEVDQLNFKEWGKVGVDAILLGDFRLDDSNAKVSVELVSVTFNKTRFKRKYQIDTNQVRRLGHRISDDIVKALSGEEGVFQTLVAFISDRSGSKEAHLCDYDGYNFSQLTNTNSITLCPAWSPDGMKLAYTSYDNSDANLYMLNWPKDKTKELSSFEGLNAFGAWSPDGRKIAFVLTKDGNSEIYTLDTRSGRISRLTHNWAIDTSPTWSPNGNKIAFTSGRSGSPQIYVMDEEGTNTRRLTSKGNYNDLPSWSPRGNLIAYSSRIEGKFQVSTIDITGSNRTVLTQKGNNESPDWAPNGYYIVFASDRLGSYQIYTMTWNGRNIKKITNTLGADNRAPVWSPRMKWKFE